MRRAISVLNLIILNFFAFAEARAEIPKEKAAFATVFSLKQRQPNWRTEILKIHANGNPESALLFEPMSSEGEKPVKQIFFYESGRIRTEVDVIEVDLESIGAKAWNSPIVPHGARVDLTQDGQVQHTAEYSYGVLNGTDRIFYPSGKVSIVSQYINGALRWDY